MKFGQCMSYEKRKKFIKKLYQNCGLKTSSRPICVCKEIKHNYYYKMRFLKQTAYNGYVIAKLSIEICSNQHADLLRTVFTEDSLKIKKGLELVSRPYFS